MHCSNTQPIQLLQEDIALPFLHANADGISLQQQKHINVVFVLIKGIQAVCVELHFHI